MRILSRYGVVLALLLFWNIICAEEIDDEFEIMDGIRVRKDSINIDMNDVGKKGKTEGKRETDEDGNEVIEDDQVDDDNDDDDDDDDDDVSGDDSEEDDLESTKHLPTKCHVCRLLAVEVENKLANIARIRKPRENNSPIYYKEEIVMLRVTEDLCDAMTKYNIRPKLPFRYKRGVKSLYRKQIDELTKDSRIQKWVFATPEVEIDDPTGEIRRLKKQCHDMLVETQKLLIHWFMKAQSRDLTKWLCAKRVLLEDNQDCLKIEMPRSNRVPSLRQRKPKAENNKTNIASHEEL
ncbi:protein canopy 4-like [Orbicella faveolata]|uniref:protein canopy 4-like n=1 Tax=Orbicella faveolata TaxID=48498 RepID=UPI0009E491C6|nr:protein canopy 4-like [Orbicella faveolata]